MVGIDGSPHGMTAQEMALLAPERIGRLVLVGTYARPDKKRLMLLKHWSELVRIDLSKETFIYNRLLWTLHDDTIEQSDLIQAMTDFYAREGAPFSGDLFARQCEALARSGDVLVALSTSGRSPNVLRALETARQRGAVTIGLLGRDGGDCRALCDHAICIPADDSAHVQEAHLVVVHLLCEALEGD